MTKIIVSAKDSFPESNLFGFQKEMKKHVKSMEETEIKTKDQLRKMGNDKVKSKYYTVIRNSDGTYTCHIRPVTVGK